MMISKLFKRSFSTVGKLLTWGETTYGWARPVPQNQLLNAPDFVQSFEDVTSVSTGPYHILVACKNLQVYSAGLGNNGRLGLGHLRNTDELEAIEGLNGVEIKKLAAGTRHSLALTQSGDVLAWGHGSRTSGIFKYIPFWQTHSSIGLGETGDVLKPTKIDSLSEKITQITAGNDVSLAVGQSGKVYGWGSGLKAIGEEPSSIPVALEQINYFLDTHHAQVKSIRSTGSNALLLLDDGRIYSVGENEAGAFGTRKNARIISDKSVETLTKIIDDDLHGQKIVTFEASNNSLIFLTDNGSVYYSGMYSKFRPERFQVQTGSVQKIFATYDSVGVIKKGGEVVFLNDLIIEDSEKKGNMYINLDPKLAGVFEIGGTYKLRYALVN